MRVYNERNWYLTRASFLLALAFLLSLTACLQRPSPMAKPSASFSLVAATPTTDPVNESLLVIGRFVGDDERHMREVLSRFTAETSIEVQYQGDGEVAELLHNLVEEGRTPDVVLLPKAHWLKEMASAQAIVPLSDEVHRAVETHFSQAWRDLVSYDNTLYGVPFDANAKSLLWYRPDALQQAGHQAPTTFEQLLDLCQELEAQGIVPFVVPGGAGWLLTDWFENIILAKAGPQLYDDLMTHRIAWTDPAVEEVADVYSSLLREPWLLGGTQEAATLSLNPENFARAFDPAQAEAAMWLGQGSIVHSFAAEKELLPGQAYDVFPFPADGNMIVIGSVAVATNQQANTMRVLNFLAQPEALESWVKAGNFISANHHLPLEHYPTQLARQEAELLSNAIHLHADLSDRLPPHLGFPFLGDQFRKILTKPDELTKILTEIEQIATREQGSVQK